MIENAGRISEGLAVNKALQGLHLGVFSIYHSSLSVS